jgi:hypothetical protein
MLKKRIAVAAMTLSLSLPALSSASPLSRMPEPDLLAKLSWLWNLLPGTHPGAAPPPVDEHRKNGPGLDPNGAPTNPAPSPSGATTTAGGDTGQ